MQATAKVPPIGVYNAMYTRRYQSEYPCTLSWKFRCVSACMCENYRILACLLLVWLVRSLPQFHLSYVTPKRDKRSQASAGTGNKMWTPTVSTSTQCLEFTPLSGIISTRIFMRNNVHILGLTSASTLAYLGRFIPAHGRPNDTHVDRAHVHLLRRHRGDLKN